MSEKKEHRQLKNRLKTVIEKCGFVADREVVVNLTGAKDNHGRYESDRSIDVVAYINENSKRCMVFFECKSGKDFKDTKKEISAWENDVKKIISKAVPVRVINSRDRVITTRKFKDIDDVRLCLVFSRAYSNEKYRALVRYLRRTCGLMMAWNYVGMMGSNLDIGQP